MGGIRLAYDFPSWPKKKGQISGVDFNLRVVGHGFNTLNFVRHFIFAIYFKTTALKPAETETIVRKPEDHRTNDPCWTSVSECRLRLPEKR